jgi:hypothetical protein
VRNDAKAIRWDETMTRVLMTLCLAAVLTGTACQSNPFQRQSPAPVELSGDKAGGREIGPLPEPGLALSPDQRFSDVPLPIGLKENIDRSYAYESATLQIGRLVYSSRASINELTHFFLRECPTAGWELASLRQASGSTEMLFTKTGKRLEIVVSGRGFGRGREVIINLAPDDTAGALRR